MAVSVQERTSATLPAGKRQFPRMAVTALGMAMCVCARVFVCVSATDCLHI